VPHSTGPPYALLSRPQVTNTAGQAAEKTPSLNLGRVPRKPANHPDSVTVSLSAHKLCERFLIALETGAEKGSCYTRGDVTLRQTSTHSVTQTDRRDGYRTAGRSVRQTASSADLQVDRQIDRQTSRPTGKHAKNKQTPVKGRHLET